MKRCSALLIIREIQIKNHNKIAPHTINMATMEKKKTSVGDDMKKLEHLHSTGQNTK